MSTARAGLALAKRCAADAASVTSHRSGATSFFISSAIACVYPSSGVPVCVHPRLSVACGHVDTHVDTKDGPSMGSRPPGPRITSAFSHSGTSSNSPAFTEYDDCDSSPKPRARRRSRHGATHSICLKSSLRPTLRPPRRDAMTVRVNSSNVRSESFAGG